MGTEMLSLLGFSEDITKLVLEHHERLDGSGYPLKLKNHQLIIESQIIAIADELSVLVSRDSHHEKTSEASSIFELVQYKGIKYSNELIDTLEQMIKDKVLLPLIK
jgi:HD-GYP domain-containing protein (c-di-GMP phosphodiesterase class II)